MTPQTLAALHAKAFSATRAWSAAEFSALRAQSGSILCGDERAFVLMRVTLDEAEILTLVTDPNHRRQGLAGAALRAGEIAAGHAGARRVFLEVAEDNQAAINLYTAAGYTKVGRRPGYYLPKNSAPIAAMVLSKHLNAP